MTARLGVYEGDVAEQLTPYLRPQEAGSHTGVRWASVTDDRGAGLRLHCEGGMDFPALPWTPFEVENVGHQVGAGWDEMARRAPTGCPFLGGSRSHAYHADT